MKTDHALLPILLVLASLAGCQESGAAGDADAAYDTAAAPAEPDDGARDNAATAPDTLASDRDYAQLRAEICDTLRNSFECARAIERQQVAAFPRAMRQGDTLRLVMGSDTVRFVDEGGDPGQVVRYSYQDHWPDTGHSLLQAQYYEGSDYLLVDASTGSRTSLPHWPLRSPDGHRFAVLSMDLVAGYGPNTLQIWVFDDGSEGEPVLEWETEPSDWGPAEGSWVDGRTLRFTQRGFCDRLGLAGQGMCDRPARVMRNGGSWTVTIEGDDDGD